MSTRTETNLEKGNPKETSKSKTNLEDTRRTLIVKINLTKEINLIKAKEEKAAIKQILAIGITGR